MNSVCPRNSLDHLSRVEVPELEDLIPVSGEDMLAIPRDRQSRAAGFVEVGRTGRSPGQRPALSRASRMSRSGARPA